MPNNVVLVASPSIGEGKTTIAANLAISLAEKGRTCLVDTDIRQSSVGPMFRAAGSKGLVDVLRGEEITDETLFQCRHVQGLAVMPAGTSSADAGTEELVLSEKMRVLVQKLRKRFDFIVMDSAPLLAYADARSLSALVDGIILVARPGVTTRQELTASAEIISDLKVPVFGMVLNGVSLGASGYRAYKYYGQAA
jgi:capsular exopolysaccharide synthesis family protein